MASGVITAITEAWTAVSTWYVSTMQTVPEIFYDSETGLTFIGVLAIFGGGLTVIIGIIGAIRRWVKAR